MYWYSMESTAVLPRQRRRPLVRKPPVTDLRAVEPAPTPNEKQQLEEDSVTRAVSLRSDAGVRRRPQVRVVYVNQIMSSPVLSLSRFASVSEASVMMREFGISHLPLVDEGEQVVGILHEEQLANVAEENLSVLPLQNILRISRWAHIGTAQELFEQHPSVSALLVSDYVSHLSGIVTRSDIAKAYAPRLDLVV